ncbi:hypothetical protein PPTG_24794 [Phytophthora nicotianae INRA-310]|uniref:Uncharacterized protein n=1 Tax=Phytophthora nicotianae (strain INRA-310) TaxID=761204 RepID=W2PCF5_PHYN3|nr:hypothetical protein PPTG_24794 [Phytophthora nicotianae INRA-310]ETM97893.1 hypothetical protein PPTG_24794 [Phytophthora nicotianae INRA-310]
MPLHPHDGASRASQLLWYQPRSQELHAENRMESRVCQCLEEYLDVHLLPDSVVRCLPGR